MTRLIEQGNTYFNRRWSLIPGQPLVYLFTALTAWNVGPRFILDNLTSPRVGLFTHHIGDHNFQAWYALETGNGTVWIWVLLGMFMPLVWLLSVFMIHSPHWARVYRGLWLRFVADIGLFVFLLMFVITTTTLEAWSFQPFHVNLTIGVTVFAGLELVRDVWTLTAIQRAENILRQ